MTDPTFRNINRLFVSSFKYHDNDPTRNYFDKYYMLLAEIKSFNMLTNNKPFSDQPLKNRLETYKRSNDYTTENLLDYLYYQNNYKLVGIDLSRQTNTTIPQQINFTMKLEDNGATMFFTNGAAIFL